MLTAVTVYGACAAVDVAQTLVVTANTVETVISDPIDGLSRANATYAIAGNNMVQTNTCPNTDTRTLGFSVATSAGDDADADLDRHEQHHGRRADPPVNQRR